MTLLVMRQLVTKTFQTDNKVIMAETIIATPRAGCRIHMNNVRLRVLSGDDDDDDLATDQTLSIFCSKSDVLIFHVIV